MQISSKHRALVGLSGLMLGLTSLPAFGHVKWFISESSSQQTHFEPFSLNEALVQGWILIALALILTAWLLESRLPQPSWHRHRQRPPHLAILRWALGLSLLASAHQGALLAPHLMAYGPLGHTLLLLQVLAGLLWLLNVGVRYGALLLLLVLMGCLSLYGFLAVLEYGNFIGMALCLLFISLPEGEQRRRWQPYCVPCLRFFTGLALVILGLREKLFGAEYGHAFMATYDWNFMAMLGLGIFDDRLFVLSAGVMEVVFGVILMLGVLTRLTTLAVVTFMVITNLTFVVQQDHHAAWMELVGHLPIIASAWILLVAGSGERLKVRQGIGLPVWGAGFDRRVSS